MRRALLSSAVIVFSAGYVLAQQGGLSGTAPFILTSRTTPAEDVALAEVPPDIGSPTPPPPAAAAEVEPDVGPTSPAGGDAQRLTGSPPRFNGISPSFAGDLGRLQLGVRDGPDEDNDATAVAEPAPAPAAATPGGATVGTAAAASPAPLRDPAPSALAATAVAAAAPVTAAAATQGQYRDGTYAGPAVNASYGYVQIQAVITDGALSAVNVLDYPSHTRRSQQINNVVLPRLRTEAIRIQSASVSSISGATLTVRAFRSSLAAALNEASG